MKKNQHNYNVKFKKVRNLFLEIDPPGLVKSGAPDDEYDSYLHLLISKFNSFTSESDLSIWLKETLEKNLGGEYGTKEEYDIVSKKIYTFLSESV